MKRGASSLSKDSNEPYDRQRRRSVEHGSDADDSPRAKRRRRRCADSNMSGANDNEDAHLDNSLGANGTAIARNGDADGDAGAQNGSVHAPPSTFHAQLVRLMVQSLTECGYTRSARLLQEESGVRLQSVDADAFCDAVRAGLWAQATETLRRLKIDDELVMHRIEFKLHEQHFLELLEERRVDEALQCLHQRLTPIDERRNAARLHRLGACLLFTDVADIRREAGYDGPAISNRERILNDIRAHLSPDLLLPHARLETLARQALELQRVNCVYHNTLEENTSLYTDHRCAEYEIPTLCTHVLQAHSDEVWHVQFSFDGTMLASASKDCTNEEGEVRVTVQRRLKGHGAAIVFVRWSADNTRLLSGAQDDEIICWHVHTGARSLAYKKPGAGGVVRAAAWLPDSEHFVAGGADKSVWQCDCAGNVQWTMSSGGGVTDLAVADDGSRLVVIGHDKRIYVHALPFDATATPVAIDVHEAMTSLHLSACGRYALVNVSDGVQQWDLDKRHLLHQYRGQKQSRFVIHSCFGGANAAFVASGSEDSLVYVWHRANGSLLESLAAHSGVVNSAAWSPTNPRVLASCSDDTTIRIWQPRKTKRSAATSSSRDPVKNGETRNDEEDELPVVVGGANGE